MSQKEIWFICPTCARPIRVAGKFIGAEFVHPSCGATVRAPDPANGRPDVELVAAPVLNQGQGIKTAEIDNFERQGLFVPRRLREGGGNIEEEDAKSNSEDDVHALAEKIARALLEKRGKGSFSDFKDGAGDELAEAVAEAGVESTEEVASETFDPIREKASRMGIGNGPVDTKALRKQFNKSLDVLRDDESEDDGEVDMLEAKRYLSREKEREVVKSMTPWEADEEEDVAARAAERAAAPAAGGRSTLFVVIIALLVIVVAIMVTKLLRDDKGKENLLDQPIRRTSGG
jgi:hypothetical protein